MTGTKGKKRVRGTTPSDVDPDKKLKGTAKEKSEKTKVSAAVINGSVDTRSSSSPTWSSARKARAPPPPVAFKSPAIMTGKGEEMTPYMTARQEGKSNKGSPPKKSTPAKLLKKLDAVKEEEESAKKLKSATKDELKGVHHGSLLCIVLLFFLWVGSSAVLGGLFLVEKMNHEMRVFELQQELLDIIKPSADQGKTASNKEGLTKLVDELKVRTAEAESKLAGYKLEFEELLTKLETN